MRDVNLNLDQRAECCGMRSRRGPYGATLRRDCSACPVGGCFVALRVRRLRVVGACGPNRADMRS